MISTINSSSNRITGLASGLETEELVTQLTQTTRNKINKASQQKQILEWKQEDYRSILTNLIGFNSKYFGSSSSNLTINKSLSQLTAQSSNTQYVKVVAGEDASSSSVYINDIKSLATAAKLQSSAAISPPLSFAVSLDNLESLPGKSMEVTLDGTAKTITFSDQAYVSSEDVATELTSLLNEAFGENRISVSGTDGNLTFSSENSILSIADSGIEGSEALDILGFSDEDVSSNRLDLNAALSSYTSLFGNDETFCFSINGEDFSFESTTTISKIIATINASDANVKIAYSNVTDTFTITSKETGTGSNITMEDTQGSFLDAIMAGSGTFTEGTNAVVTLSLDGSTDTNDLITITRNSNTFSLEGTTYTLQGMAQGTETENVNINVQLDIDSLVEKITEFIDGYNNLLGSITDKLYEERDSDFMPLTDDEEEELSESEAATWTEQARSGWLRNDSYLTSIATQMRSSLYTQIQKTDGSGEDIGIILADIGITTSDYTENGKLTIDETKLREALTQDPEKVLNLLTQESSVGYSLYNTSEKAQQRYNESGLLWRLNDIVKANINAVGKKGSLVQLVGNPNTGYVGISTYSKKISDIKETISDLSTKLQDEEDYYWSKFTAMETALNNLNAQSSWLSAQLSS